jgi:ribosomal protein S18 acetylase RimI-like enzyme
MRPGRFFRSTHRAMPASRDEAAALATIYQRAWEGCSSSGLDPAFLAEQVPSEREVDDWFAGGFEVYRTRHDDQVAGVVRLSFPAGAAFLDRLAVDPNLRRGGHGRALVEHGVARARRAGATRVWAQVNPRLAESVAFFRSFGFREAARYRCSDWRESVILLELPV